WEKVNGFEDVSTVEDYDTGFAASRIEAQDGCFVRQVTNTLEEQEAFLAAHQNTTHDIQPATDVNVMAVPLEDPEGTIGETLVDFCGELPVYKMVKSEARRRRKGKSRRKVKSRGKRRAWRGGR
ncbi:uncharacterized protein LOC135202813, partial [Macrobrachium nipponense]|uniref:uncharacterized protein LOC135202813 n=1 Tax=Macrobrachium nipponense TaxID=159736 RepID=UPI0030C8BD0B